MGTLGFRQKFRFNMFQIECISLTTTQISVTNQINAFASRVIATVKTAFAVPMYNLNFNVA
jgi:hypothetical protein